MPLALFSLLTSCNNSPKNYLSLWSKRTSTSFDSDGRSLSGECSRTIENKKVVYEEGKNLIENDGMNLESYKITYQYNDHGDLTYMEKIEKSSSSNSSINESEMKSTEIHDYRYNSKNLIEWHKIVVKNVITGKNDPLPEATEIEYVYDENNRCTKETTYFINEEGTKTLHIDVITEYPKENFKNFTKQVEIECNYLGTPLHKTTTTNTLDDEGYILEQVVTNESLNKENYLTQEDTYTYVVRDEYHCVTSFKVYSAPERIEGNLVGEFNASYWENNPEKLEFYSYDYLISEHHHRDVVNVSYDKYGRITRDTTTEYIEEIGSDTQVNIYEYDQLIAE